MNLQLLRGVVVTASLFTSSTSSTLRCVALIDALLITPGWLEAPA